MCGDALRGPARAPYTDTEAEEVGASRKRQALRLGGGPGHRAVHGGGSQDGLVGAGSSQSAPAGLDPTSHRLLVP